jgi:hypothetical protein
VNRVYGVYGINLLGIQTNVMGHKQSKQATQKQATQKQATQKAVKPPKASKRNHAKVGDGNNGLRAGSMSDEAMMSTTAQAMVYLKAIEQQLIEQQHIPPEVLTQIEKLMIIKLKEVSQQPGGLLAYLDNSPYDSKFRALLIKQMEEHANSVDQNKEDRETKPEADKGETAEADDAKSAALTGGGSSGNIDAIHTRFSLARARSGLNNFMNSRQLQTFLDLFILLNVINRLLPQAKTDAHE